MRSWLWVILLLYGMMAMWRLDALPGEWFGDISNIHEYVMEIQNGLHPWYFLQSEGPVYPYLIFPFTLIAGQKYLGYKLASVAVGATGVIAIYFMAKEIGGVIMARLAGIVTALSFWYIVWARVGNFQILVPVQTAILIWTLKRYMRTGGRWEIPVAAIVAASGLFTYPAAFVMPVAAVVWLLFYKKWKALVIFLCLLAPAVCLWLGMFEKQNDVFNFTTGFIGQKVPSFENLYKTETLSTLLGYLSKTLLMLHVKGDIIFRTNVPFSPHLDLISGIFFVLGVLYWWIRDRKFLLLLGGLGLLLVAPGVSPTLPEIDIPNIGRTIAVLPAVLLITASGMFMAFMFLERRWGRGTAKFGILVIVFLVGLLNINKYFREYPETLPNRNIAFGRIIADYIDGLPAEASVYLADCCWGEWGQPEPWGIYYQLSKPLGRKKLLVEKDEDLVRKCEQVPEDQTAIVIFNPGSAEGVEKLKNCGRETTESYFEEGGQPVFIALTLAAKQKDSRPDKLF